MHPLHLCAALVLAASLAVLGCGETTIDVGKAETFISMTVADQAGVRVKSVACPQDPEVRQGATFTCTVTGADGTTGDVVATQRDDKGNVRISAPFLHTRKAEASIAEQIEKQTGAKVKVTCPEIVVPKTGATFPCEGTDGTRTRKIESTTTDTKGNFRFRVL